MKKGKKKKKGGGAFKVTVKSEDPAAEKAEMQMKKKILEDKYIIQKTKTNDEVRRLEEARTRFIEIGQFKENEKEKYKSIESDFVHQSVLIDKNFKEKLEELRKLKEKKDSKKKELNDELERMKVEHEKRIEQKNAMFTDIKKQMEDLSSDFSKQLSEIQKDLKEQTEKVSQKWEKNPSEHIKTFAKEVEKYDINQGDNKKKENRLTYKQITKYLNVENSGEDKKNENNNEMNNNGSYDEDDFIKNEIFDEMINKMETSLDNFGLLPYLEFKVKTNDKNVRKRLINDVFNEDIFADGGNYEKYLEKNFEQGIYFYAIDINFWKFLIDPKADAPDYLDNSKIAEEINIMKMEDIYKKIESERISRQLEEERKKREEKEKKIKKNKNKENQIQNQVNNEQSKTNEENKIKEIKTKSAKLKQGMKFQKDFIIVNDDLFRILENNYKIDFIIKIKKIQEIIDFNKNQKQKN